jgi:Protein of unknown function (DUF3467)
MATDPIPTPGDDVQRLYANFVRVQGGFIDVTIDFGRQIGDIDSLQWLARITMAWEEAVLLSRFLQQHIDEVQKTMGPIRDLLEVNKQMQDSSAKDTEAQ